MQIKQTSNHIRNAVKYCIKTRYLNGKIHNGSELTINVTYNRRVWVAADMMDKKNLETSEHVFLEKTDFSDTVKIRW